jgi:hypothetical protein
LFLVLQDETKGELKQERSAEEKGRSWWIFRREVTSMLGTEQKAVPTAPRYRVVSKFHSCCRMMRLGAEFNATSQSLLRAPLRAEQHVTGKATFSNSNENMWRLPDDSFDYQISSRSSYYFLFLIRNSLTSNLVPILFLKLLGGYQTSHENFFRFNQWQPFEAETRLSNI